MANEQLKDLYNRYLSNDLSREELNDFLTMLHNPGDEQEVSEMMDKTWQQMFDEVAAKEKAKLVRMRIGWRRIAVAASIIFAIGIGAYFVISNSAKQNEKSPPSIVKSQDVPAPQTNRATITTASGRKIYLDSAANGTLATENNVRVVKTADGKIVYQSAVNSQQSTVQYNTIFNPRGSKVINLTLSDGTKVWLNSESSLKYPVAFAGNERKVSITGEAYFEVTHDPNKKFIVDANGVTTEVLGTHFNVSNYADEENIKVTLLQGSVKVSTVNSQQSAVIKPGEQTTFNIQHATLNTQHNINKDEVMAWKDGWFHFESADLKTILKQYARWYDIEVIYEGAVSDEKYFTIVNRSTSLSNVLKSLQANNVKFRIEGQKLYVEKG